jgi:hypothetical protein
MNRSIWEDELYNSEYELVVIGGGITGLSAALFFKRNNPDASVLVLDRGVIPMGASTRNAGFACIGSVGELLADLKIDVEENLRARIKARFEGLQLLRSVLGDDFIEYDDCGGWEIFTEQEKFEEAVNVVPKFNAWMSQLIGVDECYKTGEFEGYPAIFNRAEGALHSGKMMKRLIELNRLAGVEIRWQSEVNLLDPNLGVVKTGQGLNIFGHTVILATNAFTSSITSESSITPGRGFVMVTKPLPKLAWLGTFHYNKGYIYFRNVSENRLLIGGARNIDFDAETTQDFGINFNIRMHLVEFANDVLKLPEGWEVERDWSGIMGFTDSKSPQLEWIGKQSLKVAGLSGMGVALGMALGKKAAEMALNN